MSDTVRIGGASGYWGDASGATAQLLADGAMDYLVYDYLAEITLSIMARARAADGGAGFAPDFVSSALKPNIKEIAQQGTRVLSNAGGMNVEACAEAVRKVVADAGLNLKVAAVVGDDLMSRAADLAEQRDMFSGAPFPPKERVASINAYLGALPILHALRDGADIVITGRCADSALTLAAGMHAFGWTETDWDLLAAGSLAGHLLECGVQATGGNFTDWRDIECSLASIGYPIAELHSDGCFVLTKPSGSGGMVTRGTVSEQMLYEIDDPSRYVLPDVIADFTEVTIREVGPDRVEVNGARGLPCTDSYKVSTTYSDGFRIGLMWCFCGLEAEAKARRFAAAGIEATQEQLRKIGGADFREVSIEVLGTEEQYGAYRKPLESREVVLKVGAWHDDARACGLLLKTLTGIGLATPPGLTMFNGGRPKPQPVVRLFSCLLPKADIKAEVISASGQKQVSVPAGTANIPQDAHGSATPVQPDTAAASVSVPLWKLAWGRSGDKGDKANIGIIARKPEYLPWIWAALSPPEVTRRFAHFLCGDVQRYWLPGSDSINFVLDRVLGGGGIASLRNDPQGKCYAQILLAAEIPMPADWESAN